MEMERHFVFLCKSYRRGERYATFKIALDSDWRPEWQLPGQQWWSTRPEYETISNKDGWASFMRMQIRNIKTLDILYSENNPENLSKVSNSLWIELEIFPTMVSTDAKVTLVHPYASSSSFDWMGAFEGRACQTCLPSPQWVWQMEDRSTHYCFFIPFNWHYRLVSADSLCSGVGSVWFTQGWRPLIILLDNTQQYLGTLFWLFDQIPALCSRIILGCAQVTIYG